VEISATATSTNPYPLLVLRLRSLNHCLSDQNRRKLADIEGLVSKRMEDSLPAAISSWGGRVFGGALGGSARTNFEVIWSSG
jgi:hypothetical protein